MADAQPPVTTANRPQADGGEPPLINPSVAPPMPASPPPDVVAHQSPLRRLLAAFGIGRIR